MYLKGPLLIIFSVCCIALVSAGPQVERRIQMSAALTDLAATFDCDEGAFDTSAGRITCITPVSFPFLGGLTQNNRF